ncbi:hypothetical protein M9Y10_008606 [Tritrichomonas musculus]|uniref:2-phosphosulfolactate phosphatase n=1 Tax=Tritrichomonas musculus TaxID=1915356 RepID=A0ABR2IZP7_9EUKA
MNIRVYTTAQEAQAVDVTGCTAVVIDVLRATTVIPTALHRGAKSIIPVVSPEDAFKYRQQHPNENVLLGGERGMKLIDGFDLDNSPHSFKKEIIDGREIVMTTTNGTLALNTAKKAKITYVVSFANIKKSLQKIIDSKTDVTIICSGTEGNFSLEDGLCAGMIVDTLFKLGNYKATDLALSLRLTYLASINDIKAACFDGEHCMRLIRNGFAADVDFCFDTSNDFEAVVYDGHQATICK